MARQSTTARVTKTTAQCILQDCINGNGVIARYRGNEIGVVNVVSRGGKLCLMEYGTHNLYYASECTIKKHTLPYLPMINEMKWQHKYS